MKSGVGSASITLANGLTVAALVAVNAVGDVIDPATGEVIAGIRGDDGVSLVDARTLIRSQEQLQSQPGANTTLAVVATNASYTRSEMLKVAQMAHDGLARAIFPSHTPFDGDVVFALATGTLETAPSVVVVGALAADVVTEAVLRAVRTAQGIKGFPSVSDLANRE